MSFTVDLIIPELSAKDGLAWEEIFRLREKYYEDEGEKAEQLLQLHKTLTSKYPCLCSYDDDDEEMENCPWADGPMIDNFAGEMGMLAMSFSRADELLPFIVNESMKLGITVADGQSEKIYRPNNQATPINKPWWKFW